MIPTLTLAGAYHFPSGLLSWSKKGSSFCYSDDQFATQYYSIASARAACVNLGASCYGLYDEKCDGTGVIKLCKSSRVAQSSEGSCVYASPNHKTTGLFRWDRCPVVTWLRGCPFVFENTHTLGLIRHTAAFPRGHWYSTTTPLRRYYTTGRYYTTRRHHTTGERSRFSSVT